MRNVNQQQGAAMLLFILFFTFATASIMFILGQSIFADLVDFSRLVRSKQAIIVADAGVEDVVLRRVFGTYSVSATEVLSISGVTATTTTTYVAASDEFHVDSVANSIETLRKSQAILTLTGGSTFNYGLQAGNGGITLSNSSSIIGNVYANGLIIGAGSATIYGDAVSAGPSGLIKEVYATGTVYANTIDEIETDGDAHYNIDLHPTGPKASTIGGVRITPSANLPTTTFPISTTTIQEWKDAITNYGSVTLSTDPECAGGTYTIDTSITLGYERIECDVDIEETGGDIYITLDGPVWIEGNLSFTQGPTIRVDPALGRYSVQIIADNPSDRITSSQIEIRNSTDFEGSGDDRSYIMLLSMNESASLGGSEAAIDIAQSANGKMIAYTNLGLVEIGNGIDLREITGYQIDVAQNTDVIYEEGLASLIFTSGPGGGYTLTDWQQME